MGCGESRDKRELVRFVRTGEQVVADPSARAEGRGAYLCRRAACAELALRRHGFDRAFRARVTVPTDLIELTADG